MASIIIGAGEIGKSLYNVLAAEYKDIYIRDSADIENCREAEYMHIAFPYSDKFVEYVEEYKLRYNPKYTIIHSTVPVGTTRKLNAVHSPVIGIHPHLEQSIKTFHKFLSGEKASEVAGYFRRAGMKVYLFDKPETTELMKMLDTTFYGLCVEYTKEVKKECDKLGIDFSAWTEWTNVYNKGYKELGYEEYTRPNLVPIMNKIGGHCVLPNARMLNTKFAQFLTELNEE